MVAAMKCLTMDDETRGGGAGRAPAAAPGAWSRAEADRRVAAALERHKKNDIAHAYRVYREALRHHPDHAAALHYLGLVAQQTGHPRDAIRLIKQSIALEPNDPRAYNHLGQVFLHLGDPEKARCHFEKAVAVDGDHQDSLNNLANVLKAEDKLDDAVALYRRVLKLNPRSALACYNLANTLKEQQAYDEAITWFERAIAADPTHRLAHTNLAVSLEQKGRFDEAVQHYQAALRIDPAYSRPLANLIAIKSYDPPPAQIAAAEEQIKNPGIDTVDLVKLHYGLGKHYDREGRYDAAFEHFTEANRLQAAEQSPFSAADVADYFDRLIAAFTEDWFKEARDSASTSARPVFIVGMPRSGTTLTEQILASHPEIHGAGESQGIIEIAKSLKPRYPGNLAGLEASSVAALAERYLAAVQQTAPAEAVRITDKLPVNFTHLGLIASLFPNARVVHCRRDPLDVGLSCYMERFNFPNDFSTELENFGAYFLHYDRLMRHWQEVLPLPIHEQRYEDLIADHERGSRELVAFCGLAWDDACLRFQETDRSVLTPSRWQVRQPIYQSSKGRWRHYEAQMEPLRRLLKERGYVYDAAG